MTENVKVAVVGSELKERMFGAIPLIDYLLNKIFVIVQLKSEWSLVGLPTGVTLNAQPHGSHSRLQSSSLL